MRFNATAQATAQPLKKAPGGRGGTEQLRFNFGIALSALTFAALACGSGSGQDIPATVNAVSTSAQLTMVARTPGGVVATTAAPPTSAPPTAVPPTFAPGITPPPTVFAPPTNTAAPGAPTLTPSGPLIRPNGSVILARAVTAPLAIDGQLTDWGTLPNNIDQIVYRPETWGGATDQSAAFAFGWDATFLYLAVRVTDDVHVQTQTGSALYRGDSLELQLDANLAGDFGTASLNSDDYQFGFSPGDFGALNAEVYLWNPPGIAGIPQGVKFAAQSDGANGYQWEAAIPWTLLRVTPATGQTFGLAFNSSDNDTPNTAEQQSMISSVSTRKLLDPTSWGTLKLEP